MVFLDGLGAAFKLVPDPVWAVVHLVTAIVAFYFTTKVKENKQLLWAFVLYGVTGLLFTLVHFGKADFYATHVLESVLVFVAIILFGMSKMKK